MTIYGKTLPQSSGKRKQHNHVTSLALMLAGKSKMIPLAAKGIV
jgi:hypothetical protein